MKTAANRNMIIQGRVPSTREMLGPLISLLLGAHHYRSTYLKIYIQNPNASHFIIRLW